VHTTLAPTLERAQIQSSFVIMHTATVNQVLDAKDIVGESIVWDEQRGALLWIDIVGQRIHRLVVSSASHQIWETPSLVTSLGLRKDGGAVVGLKKQSPSGITTITFKNWPRSKKRCPPTDSMKV
jgi:sugar lactone lactonase YvrE